MLSNQDVQINKMNEDTSVNKFSNAKYLFSFLGDSKVHIIILTVLLIACFGRTIKSYFLADDFGEINYVHQIFAGDWTLFWSNFTGNYMQVPSMSVYRPCLLLTLMTDYLLWKTNAFGYYLTNLLYYLGDVLLVYFIAKFLTKNWSYLRQSLASFFSACFFVLNPLHCESISWVVGRVDVACCFYYLASLLLFIKSYKNKSMWITALAVFSYCVALTIKEMAIGLPVIVALYGFFVGQLDDINSIDEQKISIMTRLKSAWQLSYPLWVATIIYFVVRYLALGTILGGYGGAIGASQSLAAFLRWTDPDTLRRFFFPLNFSLYSKNAIYGNLLTTSYFLALMVIAFKVMVNKFPTKWVVFLSLWAISAAIPIYRLWGIGYDLEGARFYFFLTVPMSLLLPILVCMPTNNTLAKAEYKLLAIGIMAFILNCFVFYKLAYATNLLWVHAGKTVKDVQTAAINIATTNNNMLVLGIPKEHAGTHMILNGYTFASLLNRPFSTSNYSSKFITFQPVLYSPNQLINTSRFKEVINSKDVSGPYIWVQSKKAFVLSKIPITNIKSETFSVMPDSKNDLSKLLIPSTVHHAVFDYGSDYIKATSVKEGDGLRLDHLSLSPYTFDYIEFQYMIEEPVNIMANCHGSCFKFGARWKGANSETAEVLEASENKTLATKVCQIPSRKTTEWQTVRIHLSGAWTWYAVGEIKELMLELPACKNISIRNLCLINNKKVSPVITLSDKHFWLEKNGIMPLKSLKEISIDVSSINGAHALVLELSKPNFFFANMDPEKYSEVIGQKKVYSNTKQLISASAFTFADSGYYELRARALDAHGLPLGEYSDSIVIEK
jgi:hypothetical protein